MRVALVFVLLAYGCAGTPPSPKEAAAPPPPVSTDTQPTAEEARAFVAKVNEDLKRLFTRAGRAEWIKNTYITEDTETAAAEANEELLGYLGRAVKQAARFKGISLDPDTERMIYLLRVSSPLAAPSDANRRIELTKLGARMEGAYGKAKACPEKGGGPCRDLEELTVLLSKSRNAAEQRKAWLGWHRTARESRPLYSRFVELANEGARELGFADMGAMWRSGYDMPETAFAQEVERIWEQVRPFYEQLHCYVRGRLSRFYGKDVVPPEGPIPAHLLGNMWAQEWSNIYPIVEPYPGRSKLDPTAALARQRWDANKMVRTGEAFFTSLGLDPLPATFWQRSMLTKPRDREVVCHASAWDVTYEDDLRIKMCIKPTEEDLITIHHELGHNYYFHYYHKLPVLFQQGANDGFHEAIGDALALSITPAYYKRLGLTKATAESPEALINVQLRTALDKIAFLPFGKLIDQWRWDVFSGKVGADRYNSSFWDLRTKYQGIAAPGNRTEEDFDPGAKYHVPANVPYTRYFLSFLLQFQFHRALCRAAGHTGPLHECSIYGSKAAGERLRMLLAMGASKPWPVALEAITGERRIDAGALLDYFAPLRGWIEKQNANARCGW